MLQCCLPFVINIWERESVQYYWYYPSIRLIGYEIMDRIDTDHGCSIRKSVCWTIQNKERHGWMVTCSLARKKIGCPNVQPSKFGGQLRTQILLPDGHFGQSRAIGPMELLRPATSAQASEIDEKLRYDRERIDVLSLRSGWITMYTLHNLWILC